MLKLLSAVFVLLIYAFVYALCKVSAEADRQNERMFARYMKEKANETAQHAAGSAPAVHEG